ncbi:PKD domain-containing protein [Emticicia sp. TH156]|uniref:PKD domain-containing protein n=1 Tax=Emticicia sp. TH156 TaxID=2067454 RepID=UPI000C766501|nr:PKD domain-containing protein [Emticicia sp. TH156]PLK46428.1 hypothetical protein C0V77_03540 [Emticicia sp. TH156]
MWAGTGTNLRIYFLTATLACISTIAIGQNPFYVGGKLCRSMPAPTTSAAGSPTTSDCNEPTVFFDEDPLSTAWLWDFGDGKTSDLRNPNHLYAQAGTYTVTLTRIKGGVQQAPVTRTITISQPPTQPTFKGEISKDSTVCDGKTITLNPYNVLEKGSPEPPGVKYLWYPNGETTKTIDVTKSGCYSVEVFDASGQCSRTAKINVKFCMQSAGGGGAEKWYFGKGATLEFGINPTSVVPRDPLADNGDLFEPPNQDNPVYIPVQSTQSNPIDSPEGVAMVFDPKGDLVLYTDGVKIYSKDDQPVPFQLPPPATATSLPGTNTSTQSSLIVPKSNCNECPHHLYYVYTMNETTGRLSYSIVDMRRNGGQGAIVETDIPVSLASTEQIVTKSIEDDKKNMVFFVYSQDKTTGQFKVLKIDSTGSNLVNQPPITNKIPDESGYMKISPNGRKLATAYIKDGKNYIEVYGINATTGLLTLVHTIELGNAPPKIYGVEFSQDGEKLYYTLRGAPSSTVKSYLYQLNLNLSSDAQISLQKKQIAESSTHVFGALQMGPTNAGTGGFIYMAVDGSTEIAYITYPDALITSNVAVVNYISFNQATAPNVVGTSKLGLPNVVHAKPQQDGDGLSATYKGTCQNQPTIFETKGICSPMKNEVSWDFGDGTKGKGTQVSHTYTKPGRYTITMTVEVYAETAISKVVNIPILGNSLREKCDVFTVTDEINIKPSPIINLADSAYACFREGATLLLDPKAQNTVDPTYLWKPRNETTPTITVDVQSTYTTFVTNNFTSQSGELYTCTTDDKIVVEDKCDPRLFIPEAFSPNGDGVNDVLETPNKYITDYDLKIYNRWGEIIFQSLDPLDKWDGSYKGQIMAPMLYAFVLSYKSEYFPKRPKITKSGGILLIR